MDDKRIDDLVTTVNRIADKLDRVEEISIRNEVTLERNTSDVAEHIKRTNLLESRVKSAVSWPGLARLLGIFSIIVGICVGIAQLLGKI